MSFLIGLLTFVLVLVCLVLILLVLIQLPKKDAGAGLAFGGAATDALFGAGTGNVLTKATKYATVAFFALLLVLATLQSRAYNKDATGFQQAVDQQARQAGASAPAPSQPTAPVPASNVLTTPTTTPAVSVPPAATPAAPPPATTNQ